MSNTKLKEALKHCLINFDRRILVTDLLQDYGITYNEVNKTLEEYIAGQEKEGIKYEKRFLVTGEQLDSADEVFAVVDGEAKLAEWLKKLKKAESSLYSLEVCGGAKSPPQRMTRLRRCAIELKSLQILAKKTHVNGNGEDASKKSNAIKPEAKKTMPFAAKRTSQPAAAKKPTETPPTTKKTTTVSPSNSAASAKKSSPEVKKSPPEDKKNAQQKANNKKGGIGKFFAPATAAGKAKEKKDTKADVVKPPTPKKMEDFFKKQAETKPTPVKDHVKEVKKEAANTSVQLFADEDEEEEESSDEEEKLAALKRDIVASDHDDDEVAASSSSKRRRIEDSDDDEDVKPQQKKEDDGDDDVAEVVPSSETYLDDDGFVITIKPKKSNVVHKKAKTSPKSKSPLKAKAKGKSAAATTTAATKTKQGNIMNFFNKK